MILNRSTACALAALVLCAGAAGGCASTKGKSARTSAGAQATREDVEAQLRASIDEELARARREQGPRSEDVVFKRPFFYREYFEFPGEAGVFSLDFTEKESRTIPLTADLEVEKVRYATKLYKDQDEARGDENYFRSRGIDYITYELRSGKWRKAGDLFLAKSTEENIDGEWKQVLEKQRPRSIVQDEPSHWYDRLKFWTK
jgi:hypothetical protein